MTKSTAQISSQVMQSIKIDPERIVFAVWNQGKEQRLAVPCKASEVNCPMCGGVDGYQVFMNNFDEKAWSCCKTECIMKNAYPNEIEKIQYTQPKPSMALCGVPTDFIDANFNDVFDKEYVTDTKKFCEKFRGMLLISGASGAGKTYLSIACIQEYIKKNDDCKFINTSELYIFWLEAKKNFSDLSLLEKYSQCQLLVIDDLGTIAPKDGFLEFLYLLLNRRVNNSFFGTIITTNLDGKKMEEVLGSAIVSRVASGLIIKHLGKDKRIHKF